ncbi:DoxX family membrane protein [Mucilaginibacter sp. Mucisp86]|uniref:DoxX family membrane protein n=1 Tax=Mucilaginibacter sp. Mucisp86 TaxID=3243060 RepID=UPI0039B45690
MKNKILFVLCLLTGLMFINAGLNKFLNYMPMPKDMPQNMVKVMQAYMEIGWIMPLVGVAEIVGGLLLIFGRTRALGAVVLVPVLTGILLANISMAPSGLPIALVLTAIVVWVIIDNWEKYLPMIRK